MRKVVVSGPDALRRVDGIEAVDRLLSPEEVAAYLKVSVGTLKQWRYRGKGPRAVRLDRAVRYHIKDVRAWLAREK